MRRSQRLSDIMGWFCLNCEDFVDTYVDILKGMALSCRKCGSSRLINLKEMNGTKFDELVNEFKDKTGEIV